MNNEEKNAYIESKIIEIIKEKRSEKFNTELANKKNIVESILREINKVIDDENK